MSKNGLILLTPTTVDKIGTSATISANGSVSFTALTSLSLNGVFSANYDNYMIVTHGIADNPVALQYRLRNNLSDESGSNYTFQQLYVYSSNATGSRTVTNSFARIGGYTLHGGDIMYVYGPYLTQPTATRNTGKPGWSGSDPVIIDIAATHSLPNSYDGITFSVPSGTMSGRIAVYGMRK